MEWKKRGSAATIEQAVLQNSGLTIQELLQPEKSPPIAGLDAALEHLAQAVKKNEQITVIGDYDADGITASALLYRLIRYGFRHEKIRVRLPRRFSEGYGMSESMTEEIDSGLVITVDNGIAAFEPIKQAKEKGLRVVVLDHHLPHESGQLPEADVVVDPHVTGGKFVDYCGAGLAYRLALASGVMSEKLRRQCCILAAIGTIADVMPLIGDNRNIVREGVELMNTQDIFRNTEKLTELMLIERVTEETIGFKIGPAINAPGRLYDKGALLPFNLLAAETQSAEYLEERINQLIDCNDRRKELVRTGLEEAKLLIAENCLVGDDVILIQPSDAAPDSIHQGVAGIIAGQLAEEMRRPVIVLARSREPGVLKGSGRSYGGVNLKALLDCAKDELVTYGGHAEAAGLSVAEENIDSLSRALCRAYRDLGMTVTEETDTMYDIEIEEGDLDRAIAELNRFAPYGQGNPKPVVRLNGYHLSPRYGRHYRVQGDGSTVKLFGKDSSAVGFGMADQYQDSGCPMQIDLIGLLSENVFAGRVEKQLQMLDFRPHQEAEHKSLLTNLLEQRLKTTL